MEAVEYLSEVVIETLKEFSAERRALTPVALCDALATKWAIISLLSKTGPNGSSSEKDSDHYRSKGELARVPLKQT
ncbi:MAG: hypothetical protein ABSG91_18515, partial [Syntrophobacteraceae bacterium]